MAVVAGSTSLRRWLLLKDMIAIRHAGTPEILPDGFWDQVPSAHCFTDAYARAALAFIRDRIKGPCRDLVLRHLKGTCHRERLRKKRKRTTVLQPHTLTLMKLWRLQFTILVVPVLRATVDDPRREGPP